MQMWKWKDWPTTLLKGGCYSRITNTWGKDKRTGNAVVPNFRIKGLINTSAALPYCLLAKNSPRLIIYLLSRFYYDFVAVDVTKILDRVQCRTLYSQRVLLLRGKPGFVVFRLFSKNLQTQMYFICLSYHPQATFRIAFVYSWSSLRLVSADWNFLFLNKALEYIFSFLFQIKDRGRFSFRNFVAF